MTTKKAKESGLAKKPIRGLTAAESALRIRRLKRQLSADEAQTPRKPPEPIAQLVQVMALLWCPCGESIKFAFGEKPISTLSIAERCPGCGKMWHFVAGVRL